MRSTGFDHSALQYLLHVCCEKNAAIQVAQVQAIDGGLVGKVTVHQSMRADKSLH